MHWLAEIACAVHWFNPVAWLAARQIAALQELACDEDVLARLEPAAANELRPRDPQSRRVVAFSLASPRGAGSRLRFPLAERADSNISNYRPTSRLGSCLACLLMGALVATGLTDCISPATYGDDAPHRNPALDSILQAWRRRESQCASVGSSGNTSSTITILGSKEAREFYRIVPARSSHSNRTARSVWTATAGLSRSIRLAAIERIGRPVIVRRLTARCRGISAGRPLREGMDRAP